MIVYIIAVILAALIVITIMHDISIYRLGRKVDILQTFMDVTVRGLEAYVLGQKSNAEPQTEDTYAYDEDCSTVSTSSILEQVDEPQTERSE